jgi:hypothetical protein
VSGIFAVTGTAFDNTALQSVSVGFSGGTVQAATGTASWSGLLDTTGLADGVQRVAVRATDTAGNATSAGVDVTVKNASVITTSTPPPAVGHTTTYQPAGAWSALPSGDTCRGQVNRSTWEPRPDNTKRNNVVPDRAAVSASFANHKRSGFGTYDTKWDTWLLARVDGAMTGTTDEIFQWAACKWGFPDNLLRSIAYRESTWYQYETYDKTAGRCVTNWGCGDLPSASVPVYCAQIAKHGYDYRPDYASIGPDICPRTFSIAGVMSYDGWRSDWPDQTNGTFPFNRDSTAFAVDFMASEIRGCYEGWKWWLTRTPGDIWGCVGAWNSGDWYSTRSQYYYGKVQESMVSAPWLTSTFAATKPSCHLTYGCPVPDRL